MLHKLALQVMALSRMVWKGALLGLQPLAVSWLAVFAVVQSATVEVCISVHVRHYVMEVNDIVDCCEDMVFLMTELHDLTPVIHKCDCGKRVC